MENLVSWLKDGPYRLKVLELLAKNSYLPSELAKSLNVHRASMSRILSAMKGKGVVERSSGGSRTASYSATKLGKELLQRCKHDA